MDGLNENFSFVKIEEEILNFWQENETFQKSLQQNRHKKNYIFYDGPPFATGLPHHGHLVASTIKDVIPRYFSMSGYYVERRFGWDCHGLPIEHEIDKKLGMSAQEAVQEYGVDGYNKECRKIVQRYTTEWKKTITRLGRWVDFNNDYKTMDLSFMESVWWVFKKLWEKNLVYEGTKVVPFSTALGTVLSNFEASSNYQEVQDQAITVLFKCSNEEAYFAAWTTTPWTLPSNLCLCVGANITYVKVKDEQTNKLIYLAKERLSFYQKNHQLSVIEEITGKSLLAKKYEPLFPYFAKYKQDNCFQILNDNYVTTNEGTGIVHIAPGFGEDDNRVMKDARIDKLVCPVDNMGKFTNEIKEYANIYVKNADKIIIKDLKIKGNLYSQNNYLHSYPFCPRSKTPLIYKTIASWYIKVENIKEQMIKCNKQSYWIPNHIKHGRFGKWLEGARDWAVSRNRIWGTPLPIWRNDKNGHCICIGSIAELKKYTGIEVKDLHREFIDHLTFTVSGEIGTYKRISEVFDCWFESGSMPYAQLHYPFENKNIFEEGFPAEFIAEGLDQTRGWFYTLTVLSTAIFNKPAFKNVIVNGLVLAKNGEKMSKSLRNYTPPDALMDTHGADALRLYLINSSLVRGEEMKFSDKDVQQIISSTLLPWYNSFKFFKTYAELDQWNIKDDYLPSNNITDRWIISKMQTLQKRVNEEMQSYRLYNVVPALFDFIEDLTNTYIRLNRNRFWQEGMKDDKKSAYSTLYQILKELAIVMAPFSPFFSEFTYQQLLLFSNKDKEKDSVHLCSYPKGSDKKIDILLENAVDRMKQIILLGRKKRNQIKVKIKTPLASLTVIHRDQKLLDKIAKLEIYFATELNIKSINYSQKEDNYIKLFAKPNFPILGKRFGKEMNFYNNLIKKLSSEELKTFEQNENILINKQNFSKNEIEVLRQPINGTEALSNGKITIDIDCKLTDKLINEGLAREIVSLIQKQRKEMNFKINDRIHIYYKTETILSTAIQENNEYICRETLAISLNKQEKDGYNYQINQESISIAIRKINA